MDLELIASRILAGIGIGCLFFLIRSNIDRHKGLIVELSTIALPILIAAVTLLLANPWQDATTFGNQLATAVQFVFVCVPLFAAARICERWPRGETMSLADLFRITSFVSLTTFVYTAFPLRLNILSACLVVGIYLLGERSLNSKRVGRTLAVSLVTAFLLCITQSLTTSDSILDLFSSRQFSFMGLASSMSALLGMIGSILVAPAVIESILKHSSWFHLLAWRLAAWRFACAEPRDQIYAQPVARLWRFRHGTTFLNHGSFGAVPLVVRDAQESVRSNCADQPMDFFARQVEKRWLKARFELAVWLGTKDENLAFCENSTAAMNELAAWFPLDKGDEVLLNDHEYGAVQRIWQRRCAETGARLVTARLPLPLRDPLEIRDCILDACNEHTRLVVVSHLTSATAIRMPVEELCTALTERGIASCVDGPHAVLQEELRLYRLGCDFYTASCHKWLAAPNGSGFLYVSPKWHDKFRPARLSWGRLPPAQPQQWSDELIWTGTRDYSPYFAVPNALRFFEAFNRQHLDERNHQLAVYAWRKLNELPGTEPVTPEGREWFGWMVAVWLPESLSTTPATGGNESSNGAAVTDHLSLQERLFKKYGIEVPIVRFGTRYLVRVSCHLYNTTHDIDHLYRCLLRELTDAIS